MSSLLFAVDGQRCEVRDADPTMPLVDYLRKNGHTSAKLGCGEGGCGACTVTVAKWESGGAIYKSVNSCLLALCSCDGLSITTSAGLGNIKKGYHPIQTALADNNGSQCGFCSPGMVMSLFGKLSANKGPTCPDAKEIESCIDGNLCRCTGFRPIITAFQSFAGTPKDSVAGEKFAPFPDFLKGRAEENAQDTRTYSGSDKMWLSPGTLSELHKILNDNAGQPGKVVSVVCGHTAKGVYKDDHLVDIFVDVSRVPELHGITTSAEGIELGAAVTWSELIEVLGEAANGKPETAALPVLKEHCQKVAGHSVRNLGSIGGNLALTKKRGFQSDLATILTGVGASVTLDTFGQSQTVVPLDQFFSPDFVLPPSAILAKINLPFLSAGEVFKCYRTAIRPINSHALANAAFTVKTEGGLITSARLVFGALESRPSGGPIRATKAESALMGKAVDTASLQAAQRALVTELWWPEDEFERHLCLGFLYKMFHTLNGSAPEKAPPLGVSLSSERPATKGTQAVLWADPTLAPIGEAMPKTSSKLQAAGEQSYTDDLPVPERCLFAAYVSVPRAKALFVEADMSAAEKMPGYVGFVCAEDIPGANVCELSQTHKLLVAKGSESQYAGQPCLMILADSTRHAEAAAKAVVVKIDIPADGPILSIDAAVKANKVRSAKKYARGDASAALASATHKVTGGVSGDSQKAFAMEPSAGLVIPGEDNTLSVWGTFQVQAWAHGMTSSVTGLPKNKITMNATHMGGGFGGKLMKSLHVVCAPAVAAVKFGRPVKLCMNRNMDTIVAAGRLPIDFQYEVGFDDTGKIGALKLQAHADEGQGDGCAGFAAQIMVKNMEQIYCFPNMDLEAFLCTTNKPGNTAVRGPGEPQSALISETIMAHVAAELGKDPQEVKEVNIFKDLEDRAKVAANPTSKDVDQYSSLAALGVDIGGAKFQGFPGIGIWMSLKEKADFDGKTAAATAFNSQQQWRKRGVAMTPVKYAMETRHQQVLVCLYDDATCLITMDGSEIGQGIHTKVKQFAAYYLSQIVPGCKVTIDQIRCGPTGTDKVAHASITGGSTTSEGVCEAVRDAISKLAVNLEPAKLSLEAAGKEISSLKQVIGAASSDQELQASGKNPTTVKYHTYGASLAEVEVDMLTGETTILSVSILYDCGKSLNPTIDLGQCEGGFMMGVGYFLRERRLQDAVTGEEITNGTWEYKVPCFQDVPLEFNVEFFPRAHEAGIVSSKASGEPPLVLSSSVFCALRQAVTAAREQTGKKGFFRMDAPCTPRDIALLIGAASENMQL